MGNFPHPPRSFASALPLLACSKFQPLGPSLPDLPVHLAPGLQLPGPGPVTVAVPPSPSIPALGHSGLEAEPSSRTEPSCPHATSLRPPPLVSLVTKARLENSVF